MKIGIVWRGYSNQLSIEQFSGLAAHPRARLFGLQVEISAQESAYLVERLGGVDLGPHLRGFAPTAAIMNRMDLIITVDTSAAHLAGAIGRPVWCLLRHDPDFRWLIDRADSPWYPTMRLFRARRPGGWEDLFAEVVAALDEYLAIESP